MIVMNSLTQEDGARIAALMLEKVKARMESRGICLRYDPQVAMLLAQNGVNDMSGARNLRRVVAELIEDPLSELILRGKAGREVRLSVEKNKITVTGEQEALAPGLTVKEGFFPRKGESFFIYTRLKCPLRR